MRQKSLIPRVSAIALGLKSVAVLHFHQLILRTFFGLLIVGVAHAAQWEIPHQELQELQLRAKAGKLLVRRTEGAMIKVRIEGSAASTWSQDVRNGVLSIVGPEENTSVEDSSITIELPLGAYVATFVFEDVRAELQNVSRVTVHALKGQIIGRSTGEGVHYFMQKGEIQSFKHTGALEIENFGGKVTVTDGQSSFKVRLFSGDLQIEKNLGSLLLESHSSTAKIRQQHGIVGLQWGKGTLTMEDFSGRLEGTSSDGQLLFKVNPDSVIDLQATRGKVNVNLPTNSGAKLNLRTVAGEVSVPSPLRVAREGRFRVAKGVLSGALKGSINIRTEEATIGIR
jgi:DUF4097 and DUF4098 domain-containing protein YvlB